ncbi:MAG: sigma-70 family RNA polymerase sigma factor [Armatimonadetes bacterium]|nr:sigma-70 family RNA polymerase sigma factor [Armatimonadota bacterium]
MARRFAACGVPLDDLVQEGSVGLIHAVDRFDAGRGVPFGYYAALWIRHALRRAVAGPGPAGDAEAEPPDLVPDADLLDSLADPRAHAPEAGALEAAGDSSVRRLLSGLDERESQVLIRRLGLFGEREHTLAEIGAALGLSRQRVQQLEQRALARLRPGARP